MKKLISVLLSIVMVFALAVPVFAVEDASADYPTIYIEGKGNITIYNEDGTPAKNPDSIDIAAYVEEKAGPVLKDFALALTTGDYSKWIASLTELMGYIYDGQTIGGDGQPVSSYTKADEINANPTEKTSNFGLMDYIFKYDWRLNPMDTADKLDAYIEKVLEVTGAEKVNIVARCLGTQPATAYLYKSYNGEYDHEFRVANVVLDTPSVAGYITLGGLFSGRVVMDSDSVDKFVSFYMNNQGIFANSGMNELATVFVSILNRLNAIGYGSDVVAKVINDCGDELISSLGLATYAGYPSYFSMVGDEYYEDAVNTIFYSDELKEEYAGFIEDIEEYNNALGKVDPETGLAGYEVLYLNLKEMGVNTAVFAKYGAMQLPLFEGCEITGDMRGTATELSLGATASNFDSKLSDEYLEEAKANGTDKYISADKQLDASTCLFPETTWFVKNISHDNFPAEVNEIALEFLRSDGKTTVFTSEKACGQFMDYSTGKLEAVSDKNSNVIDDSWGNDWVSILKRFIQSIINSILKIFGIGK